jgi:hypothetical protein
MIHGQQNVKFTLHFCCGTGLFFLKLTDRDFFCGPGGKFVCYCRPKGPSEEEEDDDDDDDDDEGEESLLDELDDFSNQNTPNARFYQQQKTSSVTLPIRAPPSRPVCRNVNNHRVPTLYSRNQTLPYLCTLHEYHVGPVAQSV